VRRAEIIRAQQYEEEGAVLSYLRAKISKDNERSIKLFESLLFKKTSDAPNYFGEYELVLRDLDIVRIIGAMRARGVEGWKNVEYSYGEDQKP
jgi:L-amino acid N-acyltransferase YncA